MVPHKHQYIMTGWIEATEGTQIAVHRVCHQATTTAWWNASCRHPPQTTTTDCRGIPLKRRGRRNRKSNRLASTVMETGRQRHGPRGQLTMLFRGDAMKSAMKVVGCDEKVACNLLTSTYWFRCRNLRRRHTSKAVCIERQFGNSR